MPFAAALRGEAPAGLSGDAAAFPGEEGFAWALYLNTVRLETGYLNRKMILFCPEMRFFQERISNENPVAEEKDDVSLMKTRKQF